MTCSVVLDFASRRVLRSEGPVQTVLLPPGSTLKPFVLSALLDSGKLTVSEAIPCPLRLIIAGRSFSCTHPRMATPLTAAPAIAYSCNHFVAAVAKRFAPGELARYLAHAGFAAARVKPATDQVLQSLGVQHIAVTPNDLVFAYRGLAAGAHPAILEGLESAVEFGTAQGAAVKGMRVAGKTGTAPGNAAWFAGFAPSRQPRAVVVVLAGGRSGGADAAPLAAKLLEGLR